MSFAIDVRIIRLVAVAAASVVCPLFASSYCVEVTTLYQPSTQNARIHVFLQGKPHPDVKVAVFTPDGQLRLVVHTDSDAMAKLPKLPAGKYCLNAMGGPDLGAQLCLDISKRVSRSPDNFSLDLGSEHGVSGWVSYNFLRAEEKAPTTKLQSFAGLVQDASGASIPRTVIFVARHGSQDLGHPVKFFADQEGHFSEALQPGVYTAEFQAQGFRSQVVIFEVTADASEKDFLMTLQVGGC
jgi:hypothetical protein